MEKKENTFKLGLILLIITACAGVILGLAYTITKGPIEKQAQKQNTEAMKEILSKADNFNKVDIKLPENIIEVNEAKSGSNLVGHAIKVKTKGYGGLIELMVGISKEGSVEGVRILSQSETPGLGANSTKPEFYDQYKGKSAKSDINVVKSSSKKDNEETSSNEKKDVEATSSATTDSKEATENDITALTGATVTSKAITSGVNEAIKLYNNTLKGGSK